MIPRLDGAVDLGRDQKRMPAKTPASTRLGEQDLGGILWAAGIRGPRFSCWPMKSGWGRPSSPWRRRTPFWMSCGTSQEKSSRPILRKCYRAVVVVTPAGNQPPDGEMAPGG